MKKLFFFIISFFIFSYSVNAITPSNFNVTFAGSTMTTTNFFLPNSNDTKRIHFYNWYQYSATTLTDAGPYFKLAFCSVGTLQSVSNVQYSSDLNFYNTSAKCNLNSTPGYTGKIIYVTGEVPWDDTTANVYCGANLSSCFYDSKFDMVFKTGGYIQLINLGFSNEKYIYDSTSDTLISQNETIINSQNSINNNINSIDNSINDSTVSDPNNILSSMESNLATNSVISDLLLLPVTFYQNILNNLNTTCTSYNLGSLFDTNIVLPCKNINDLFGSTISSILDVGLCGIFVLSIRKKFISIFENITSLNDRGNELE